MGENVGIGDVIGAGCTLATVGAGVYVTVGTGVDSEGCVFGVNVGVTVGTGVDSAGGVFGGNVGVMVGLVVVGKSPMYRLG